jgi:hypothetical protein
VGTTGATGATGATGTAETVNAGASIYATVGQTIPRDSVTQINFDGADYVTGMTFDPATSSLVVQTAGRYLLKGRLLWQFLTEQPTAGAGRSLILAVNGGFVAWDDQGTSDLDSKSTSQEVSTTLQLNVGDVITLHALQGVGNDVTSVAFTLLHKTAAPQLQAEWLAP